MAVSTALSIAGAGAGTRFSGDFQQLGRVETRLSQKPRKHSGWLCMYRHQLPHYYKCFWQESRTEKLSFKQSLALRKDSDDGFLSVWCFISCWLLFDVLLLLETVECENWSLWSFVVLYFGCFFLVNMIMIFFIWVLVKLKKVLESLRLCIWITCSIVVLLSYVLLDLCFVSFLKFPILVARVY